MRQIQYQIFMRADDDHAAYLLTAEGPFGPGCSLEEYIDAAASRDRPRHIQASCAIAVQDKTAFYAQFVERCNQQKSPTFENSYLKLLEGKRPKGWALTAVEIDPGEWRLHLVNHSLWNRHRKAIEAYRSAHASEPGCAKVPNSEITADLPPYHETLVCRADNGIYDDVRSIVLKLDIPRFDVGGYDQYTIGFTPEQTVIGEPFGLAARSLLIENTAYRREYYALVVENQ